MDDVHEHFMREALRVAREGLEAGELPIGAVVVLDDRILAESHTMERREKRLLVHADLLALEAADRLQPFPGKRRDVRLYVNLEPCLMCMGAAMSFFLGELHYGLESPGDGAVSLVRMWQRKQEDFPSYHAPKLQGGLLKPESRELFREYVDRHSSGPMWEWAKTIAALPLRGDEATSSP
jgi:tRNA(adenine34) deaminase